jgi:hypothetical protein
LILHGASRWLVLCVPRLCPASRMMSGYVAISMPGITGDE